MKTLFRKSIGIACTLALLCCIISVGILPVSAEETEQYINLQDTPENIQALFEDAGDVSKLRILESEDVNSIVVEDAQGNGTVKVFGAPVRYTDDNGKTQFIDTSMTDESVVSSVFSGYDHQSKIGKTAFKFSKKPDKGVRVDKAFRLAVYNPDKNKFPKGYSETLEDGSGRMVYPEAFGEHTYVEYININTGLKENIVLEKNIGKNRFDFVFDSKEYIPILSEDASFVTIVRRDNPDEVKYTFTPLYVYDSFKSEEVVATDEEPSKVRVYRNEQQTAQLDETVSQEQAVRHFTEDNCYEVVRLEDGTYRIICIVSKEFLDDPNTVYPVVIDPTFGATNSNAEDTYVLENSTSDFGALDYIRFGRMNGNDMIGYFRFKQLPSLPSYVNITNATLKFTFRPGQTSGANGICFIVRAPWYESGTNRITWENQPYGEWGYTSSHHNFQYYEFYVKPFVEMWYYGNAANFGVDFTYQTMINDYNSVVSSEGNTAKAPTLTITYSNAIDITENTLHNNYLEENSVVWYKFTPTNTNLYSIYTTGSLDTYGSLFYTDVYAIKTENDGGDNNNFLITHRLLAGETYYVKVMAIGNTPYGNYSFGIEKSNQKIFDAIKKVYQYAKMYSPNATEKGLQQLTLGFIRSNNRYDQLEWELIAGEIPRGFVNYVNARDSTLMPFFDEDTIQLIDGNYNEVDFHHMITTLTASLYLSAIDYGKFMAGWAGDLQSLVPEVKDKLESENKAFTESNIYDKTYYLFSTNSSNNFKWEDLYADIDAYNIYICLQNLTLTSFEKYFEYYYNSVYTARFSVFTQNWNQDEVSGVVDDYLSGVLILGDFMVLDVAQKSGFRRAFVDYLWYRVQLE